MDFPRPEVDIRAVPAGFDDLADWFDRWSTRLVLLEQYPLPIVAAAIREVETAVRAHRAEFDPWVQGMRGESEEVPRGVQLVLSDHEWFETSLTQLWWFYGVVEKEDHGGHRQALGQFGRVFAEALKRHRADERHLELAVSSAASVVSVGSRQP